MKITKQTANARAGLIGNPSDGYGGRTIAFTIGEFAAEVVLYPWDQLEIIWSRQDKNRFDSIDDLVEDVNLNGYYGGVRLIKATIKRFADFCREQRIELHRQPFSVRYTTNIPRGVGLAGSSAIVVATLRCLVDFYDVDITPALQASLARSVENDELGIACGYQDRVAQVLGGISCMDFGNMQPAAGLEYGEYATLTPDTLPSLYVAYDLAASKTSASVHGPLRTRLRQNSELGATMSEIADLVLPARSAIENGDHDQLHALIDQNFDLRCRLYDIQADHMAMVQAARATGASAKFAGSGGAIVGCFRDQSMFEQLCQALQTQNPNWHVLRPTISSP